MSWLANLNILDALIAVIGLVALLCGLRRGAVDQILSIGGLLAAALLAINATPWAAESSLLRPIADGSPSLARVVAFAALFAVSWVGARLIAAALTTRLRALEGVGLLDRVLGGVLGVAKAAIVLGALAWFAASFEAVRQSSTYSGSELATPLARGCDLVLSWLPPKARDPLESWAGELQQSSSPGELIISLGGAPRDSDQGAIDPARFSDREEAPGRPAHRSEADSASKASTAETAAAIESRYRPIGADDTTSKPSSPRVLFLD